jgi:hypothetical protein
MATAVIAAVMVVTQSSGASAALAQQAKALGTPAGLAAAVQSPVSCRPEERPAGGRSRGNAASNSGQEETFDDEDRQVGFGPHGIRDTSEHEPLPAGETSRAQDNGVAL